LRDRGWRSGSEGKKKDKDDRKRDFHGGFSGD
jgi:hypothetical protein